jgi:hypothetical protein
MFAVIWRTRALDELANALVRSDLATQDQIEDQVKDLNRRLALDPVNEGESRSGNIRVTFADSVGIIFEVAPADGIVRVLSFWTY